jgi:hypothetical protein
VQWDFQFRLSRIYVVAGAVRTSHVKLDEYVRRPQHSAEAVRAKRLLPPKTPRGHIVALYERERIPSELRRGFESPSTTGALGAYDVCG